MNFWVNLKISKISYDRTKAYVEPNRKELYIKRVFSLFDYAKELRVTNISNALINLYNSIRDDYIKIIKKYNTPQMLLSLSKLFAQTFLQLFTLFYLSIKLVNHAISVGEFSAGFNSNNQLSTSILNMLNSYTEFYKHSLFIEDFEDFLNYVSRSLQGIQYVEEIDKIDLIEFQNVSFNYGNTNILKNVNFKIHRGEKIAFIGSSGAGKSTLIYLILGLYKATSGKVLINGIDIQKISPSNRISLFSVFFQDYKMYSLSILENILQNSSTSIKPETISDIYMLLRELGLEHVFRGNQRDLFDYVGKEFDDNGVLLSGGETQRLAVSRVFAKESSCYIMDEPSSALDATSEEELFHLIFTKLSQNTGIIITHKLSNIRNMDCIFVLDHGEIIEKGTHNQLIEKNGMYAYLYKKQNSLS